MERCESKELDVEIRNLIEKNNTSQSCEDPEPIAQESPNRQRTLCSSKARSETNAQGHLGCGWAGVSDMEAPADLLESRHMLLTKKKTVSASSLEQQILSLEKQRRELAEMKAKLDMSERRVGELEEERHRQHPEDGRLRALGRERQLQEMALLDALKKQHSPVLGTPSEKGDRNSLEDMRTQLEVLRQQVQIYEEDFRKERSDRERLNGEKEALQKVNERLQSQLNKLSSQTKDLQVQSERPSCPLHFSSHHVLIMGVVGGFFTIKILECNPVSRRTHEQQQHSPDYQWYVPDQFPPDVQHKANDSSSGKGAHC